MLNFFVTETLPIFFVLFKNFPMASFALSSSNFTVSKCNDEIHTIRITQAASDVIGAQVGKKTANVTELSPLLSTPVHLNFTFNTQLNGSTYRCLYWNFSHL